MFYSSNTKYGIPLDEDIYNFLKKQFDEYNLHVIYMLSDNYYNSAACLNEMGAAWILQNHTTSILLPGYEYKSIKGAVNAGKIGMKIDDKNMDELKGRLDQLKDYLVDEFELDGSKLTDWQAHRDKFIKDINAVKIV